MRTRLVHSISHHAFSPCAIPLFGDVAIGRRHLANNFSRRAGKTGPCDQRDSASWLFRCQRPLTWNKHKMESFSYVVLIIIEFPIFSHFYLFVLPFLYMANQQGSPTAPINITGSTHKRRHSSSIGSLSKLPVLSASWGSLRGMSVSIGTIPHFFYVC